MTYTACADHSVYFSSSEFLAAHAEDAVLSSQEGEVFVSHRGPDVCRQPPNQPIRAQICTYHQEPLRGRLVRIFASFEDEIRPSIKSFDKKDKKISLQNDTKIG